MGPGHLLTWWKNTARLAVELERFNPRKAVVFVFGVGSETTDRCATRLGGLPYWPKEMPWPEGQDGQPKSFVGQFDFRAIIWPERLPGDILTVHFDDYWDGEGRFCGTHETGAATLTWHDSQVESVLLDQAEVPSADPYGPYYGRPVEVTDYKETPRQAMELGECWQFTILGMKIGGHSPLFGRNWQDDIRDVKEPVFLCSIGFVESSRLVDGVWLPTMAGYDPRSASEVIFLDAGTFVVVYPKGSPEKLHWFLYLP